VETRREALKIIGAVGVTCSFPFSANELYGQHVHPPEPAPEQENKPAGPFEPAFFTKAQFQIVSRLSDLIIPATDTPGAVAAGVPEYIDSVVTSEPKLQSVFRNGLERLGNFLELSEAQQIERLTAISEAALGSPDRLFFQAVKNLTADGYYTSRIGLIQELGYDGDAVLPAFPEFSIPEH
jgi:gluconate 2-dehydrogenase gamma chain